MYETALFYFFSVTEFLWVHIMHPDPIQFFHSYFFWACYMHLPMGSVPLCFPGKVQVSLSLALHLVSWMISSPSSVASAILYFLYSMVLGAKDNNTDRAVAGPSHGPWFVQTQMTPWPRVTVQATHICMAPAKVWPLDINKGLDGSPNPISLCCSEGNPVHGY